MKKTTIISSIVIIFCLILLAFTQTKSESKLSPQNNVVKFRVEGCDNCSSLGYCIDGQEPMYSVECAFSWLECTAGNHTIWVGCSNNKSGSHIFTCRGTGGIQDEVITVTSNGPPCPCQTSK